MAAKYKPISVYPDPALRKKIEGQAQTESRKLGPMILEIIKRYFEKAT